MALKKVSIRSCEWFRSANGFRTVVPLVVHTVSPLVFSHKIRPDKLKVSWSVHDRVNVVRSANIARNEGTQTSTIIANTVS